MDIDVEAARAATSGTANVAHLNNAGAALPPDVVVDTVVAHLRREAEIGGYEAGAEAHERREAVYRSLATLVGGAPEEIALTDSATRAWDAAFYPLAKRLRPGQRIVTTRAEYPSNLLAALHVAVPAGVSLHVVDADESGQVDLRALADVLATGDVGLVCLTHVPTSGGLVEPVAAVGRLAREAGVPYLLDACQSIGQLRVDVAEIGCDALSATGRKYLRAPRGTGFLWIRRDLAVELEPHVVDLHAADLLDLDRYRWRDDARRFEQWESSVAADLGLGAAVDHALGWGIDAVEARVVALGESLRSLLGDVDGVTVRDVGSRRCGIVTFTVDGVEPQQVIDELHADRVNVWKTSGAGNPLDLGARGIDGVVRASVHYYNTDAELTRCAELVGRIAKGAKP